MLLQCGRYIVGSQWVTKWDFTGEKRKQNVADMGGLLHSAFDMSFCLFLTESYLFLTESYLFLTESYLFLTELCLFLTEDAISSTLSGLDYIRSGTSIPRRAIPFLRVFATFLAMTRRVSFSSWVSAPRML